MRAENFQFIDIEKSIIRLEKEILYKYTINMGVQIDNENQNIWFFWRKSELYTSR